MNNAYTQLSNSIQQSERGGGGSAYLFLFEMLKSPGSCFWFPLPFFLSSSASLRAGSCSLCMLACP